jgi:hypothetical protein
MPRPKLLFQSLRSIDGRRRAVAGALPQSHAAPNLQAFLVPAASKFIKAFELAKKLSVFGGGIPAHRLHPLFWKTLS